MVPVKKKTSCWTIPIWERKECWVISRISNAVNGDGAFLDVIKPWNQGTNRCFPCARWTNKGDRFARANEQVDAFQYGFIVIITGNEHRRMTISPFKCGTAMASGRSQISGSCSIKSRNLRKPAIPFGYNSSKALILSTGLISTLTNRTKLTSSP